MLPLGFLLQIQQITGQWHIEQLNPDLQNIIKDRRNHFDGEPVPEM